VGAGDRSTRDSVGRLDVRKEIAGVVSDAVGGSRDVLALIDLSWSTYTKLKHRTLHHGKGSSVRVVVDDSDIEHMGLLSSFRMHVTVLAILTELGFGEESKLIGYNLSDNLDVGIVSKYHPLLAEYVTT
jgi:hypothetical protein